MKTISLAILIFLFGMSSSPTFADDTAETLARAAAQGWLAKIDAGKYADTWKDASSFFRGALTEKAWVDALNAVRKPLGSALSRKSIKAESTKSLPGAPDGNYVVMQFNSSFANKKAAVETVTFMQDKDGKWRAAGYYIK